MKTFVSLVLFTISADGLSQDKVFKPMDYLGKGEYQIVAQASDSGGLNHVVYYFEPASTVGSLGEVIYVRFYGERFVGSSVLARNLWNPPQASLTQVDDSRVLVLVNVPSLVGYHPRYTIIGNNGVQEFSPRPVFFGGGEAAMLLKNADRFLVLQTVHGTLYLFEVGNNGQIDSLAMSSGRPIPSFLHCALLANKKILLTWPIWTQFESANKPLKIREEILGYAILDMSLKTIVEPTEIDVRGLSEAYINGVNLPETLLKSSGDDAVVFVTVGTASEAPVTYRLRFNKDGNIVKKDSTITKVAKEEFFRNGEFLQLVWNQTDRSKLKIERKNPLLYGITPAGDLYLEPRPFPSNK